MKRWIALLLLAVLAACAQVDCPTKERDGGIGGTGQCSDDSRTRLAGNVHFEVSFMGRFG